MSDVPSKSNFLQNAVQAENIRNKQARLPLELLGIWFALRIATHAAALIPSAIRPLLSIEKTIDLWPPTLPISSWLERILLAPWLRWDAEWYLRIVSQGYRADDGTAQFHPLYPWLATPLAHLGIHPLFSLLLVSSVATLLLMWVFEKLAHLDLPPDKTRFATMLFILFPGAFILFAPYSEALFLFFAILCFLFMRHKRLWLAGAAAGLAALTRQQGLFLLLPLAWEIFNSSARDWRKTIGQWRNWLSMGLVPAGYLVWLIYRWLLLSDLDLSTASLNSIIYSFLISPSADQVVEVQAFLWPWQALSIALHQAFSRPDLDLITNLVYSAYFLVLLVLAWKHLSASYRVYSIFITLVSFGYYTGPIHPYMGLLRHLLLAFPVFIGLASRLHYPWQRLSLVTMNLAGYLFLVWMYVLHAWVP